MKKVRNPLAGIPDFAIWSAVIWSHRRRRFAAPSPENAWLSMAVRESGRTRVRGVFTVTVQETAMLPSFTAAAVMTACPADTPCTTPFPPPSQRIHRCW